MTAACVWLLFIGMTSLSYTAGQGTTAAHHFRSFRTVCYMAGWARYRQDPVQFVPEDIDTSLCTHLIFAFVGLDKTGTQFLADDPASDPQMYRRLTDLKREKRGLKVLLSVGGWKMGSAEFTMAVSSQHNMRIFAINAVEYLHRYNFDGLDVDWEYPADRGSPPEDKHRFTQLLQTLQEEFNRDHKVNNRSRLMLTVAISPAPLRVNQSYELVTIANYVDFITVMTYDLHGTWDHTVGHHSALYSPTEDQDSVDYMINWMLSTSVPARKLNMGLPFYGQALNLTDPTKNTIGSPINGAAAGGGLLGAKGVMAYYEVCKLLTEHMDNVTVSGRLPNSQAPFVVDGSRYTAYDDVNSIKEKVDYVVQHGLGGMTIWSIDMDDFHGICGSGHYPLMNAIRQQLHNSIVGRR